MNDCRSPVISGGALIVLAFFILLLPLDWLVAVILAALVHEASHYLAVTLCGGKVQSLRIGAGGAVIHATCEDPWRKLICIVAGPMGGLSLLLLARWLPRTAFCAFIQSGYNLLPIRPLDGAGALRCCMEMFLSPERAEEVCKRTESVVRGVLAVALSAGAFSWKLGVVPVLIAGFLLFRKHSERSAVPDIFTDPL